MKVSARVDAPEGFNGRSGRYLASVEVETRCRIEFGRCRRGPTGWMSSLMRDAHGSA